MARAENPLDPNRSALHHFGYQLRELRKARHFSQDRLGATVHVSGDLIQKVETGQRRPQGDFAERCDHALGAEGALIESWQGVEREQQAARHAVPHTDMPVVGMTVASEGFLIDTNLSASVPSGKMAFRVDEAGNVWAEVNRRSFMVGSVAALLGGGVTAAPGSVPPQRANRLLAAPTDGPQLIEHLRRVRLLLVDSDNLLGPRHVIPSVHQHIGIIQQLRTAAKGVDRRTLVYLQAQYGEFAGWLYQDAGDFGMAGGWTDRALEWSQIAGDSEMTAYILARKSQLAGEMRDSGNALDYAEAALNLAPPRSRLRAAAAAYAAHAYALAGTEYRDDVLRMHDDAHATLDKLDTGRESPWAVWMDEAYLAVERARCLSLTGSPEEAAKTFQQAIERVPEGFRRDRGVYLAREALAHASAGEPELAANVGGAALSVAIETGSGRIVNELAQLDKVMAQWRSVPDVAEFRDCLTATLPHEKDRIPLT